MSTDGLKEEYIPRYLASGEQKFYRFLLVYALNKLVIIDKGDYKGVSPELEFLTYHSKFLIIYRREGDDNCLQVASLFRKAAHKIYRIMLKKKMTTINNKFLNLV